MLAFIVIAYNKRTYLTSMNDVKTYITVPNVSESSIMSDRVEAIQVNQYLGL